VFESVDLKIFVPRHTLEKYDPNRGYSAKGLASDCIEHEKQLATMPKELVGPSIATLFLQQVASIEHRLR
jgi:hypothetical protein